jgi:hypothetical protein
VQFNIKPRSLITTAAEVAGFASVTAGAWLIYLPAGLITAGVSAILIGVFAA